MLYLLEICGNLRTSLRSKQLSNLVSCAQKWLKANESKFDNCFDHRDVHKFPRNLIRSKNYPMNSF